MPSLQKLKEFVGVVPSDPHLQWIEELDRLSDQAWEEGRFAQANELARIAEVQEREYLASIPHESRSVGTPSSKGGLAL